MILTRAAIEQIEAREVWRTLAPSDDLEVYVRLTPLELNALCALAKIGLERPTCAMCRCWCAGTSRERLANDA